ncbi:MAG TPA: zinc ribbon domain-containing protein [Ignavibacteria bacterium]|jgi:putative FmdB family regulatory protein
MPIYEYKCKDCGHHLEELQSISEPPLLKCPICGKDTLARLIGGGGGVIFKGSGFYLTDYKKNSSRSQGEKEKTSEKSSATEKSETKPETKSIKPFDNKSSKAGKESKKK